MRTGRARVGVVAALAAACACGLGDRPDPALLPAAVAAVVVSDGIENNGATLIVDSTCFQFADPGVLNAIQDRLTTEGIPWEATELGCDVDRIPDGAWLLRVDLRGKGAARTLTWTVNCGPKCGVGEKVDLRWEDGAWTHERVAVIRI